jgi:hypothetical protein
MMAVGQRLKTSSDRRSELTLTLPTGRTRPTAAHLAALNSVDSSSIVSFASIFKVQSCGPGEKWRTLPDERLITTVGERVAALDSTSRCADARPRAPLTPPTRAATRSLAALALAHVSRFYRTPASRSRCPPCAPPAPSPSARRLRSAVCRPRRSPAHPALATRSQHVARLRRVWAALYHHARGWAR